VSKTIVRIKRYFCPRISFFKIEKSQILKKFWHVLAFEFWKFVFRSKKQLVARNTIWLTKTYSSCFIWIPGEKFVDCILKIHDINQNKIQLPPYALWCLVQKKNENCEKNYFWTNFTKCFFSNFTEKKKQKIPKVKIFLVVKIGFFEKNKDHF
jgi:hypothetical protein